MRKLPLILALLWLLSVQASSAQYTCEHPDVLQALKNQAVCQSKSNPQINMDGCLNKQGRSKEELKKLHRQRMLKYDIKNPVLQRNRAARQQYIEYYSEIISTGLIAQNRMITGITAYATDYNESIQRYECEAHFTYDKQAYYAYLPSIALLVFVHPKTQEQQSIQQMIFASMEQRGNISLLIQAVDTKVNLERASEVNLNTVSTIRYTVQPQGHSFIVVIDHNDLKRRGIQNQARWENYGR